MTFSKSILDLTRPQTDIISHRPGFATLQLPTPLFELPTSLFELRRDKTTGQVAAASSTRTNTDITFNLFCSINLIN